MILPFFGWSKRKKSAEILDFSEISETMVTTERALEIVNKRVVGICGHTRFCVDERFGNQGEYV